MMRDEQRAQTNIAVDHQKRRVSEALSRLEKDVLSLIKTTMTEVEDAFAPKDYDEQPPKE